MKKVVVAIIHYEKCSGELMDKVVEVKESEKETLAALPQKGYSNSWNEDSLFPLKYMLAYAYEADTADQTKGGFKAAHPETGADFMEIEKADLPTGDTCYFLNPEKRGKFCTAVYFLPVIGKKPAEEIRRGEYIYNKYGGSWQIDTYKEEPEPDHEPLDIVKTLTELVNSTK